jgi:peptidoglycan/xylan/chitin deacetylase (PgdA/CDA1 family)
VGLVARWRSWRPGPKVHAIATRVVRVRWTLPRSQGIALTFDDGPDPRFTGELLEILDRHDVRATFFVTGASATAHPELVREAARRGHAIGSHSLHHPFVADCGLLQVLREYRTGRRAVERVLGRQVRLFRPPGSDLGYRSLLAMGVLGLRPYLCSVDPEDWRPTAMAPDVLDVLTTASAGDIVLMHDSIELPHDERALDRSETLRAVDRYLHDHRHEHDFVTLD